MQRRAKALLIVTVVLAAVGVWWWQWQAPYRTLTAFLVALQRGDVSSLYALTPNYERRFVTPELVARAYTQVIKPQLLEGKKIDRIWRTSLRKFFPELWLGRVRSVRFYLWVRDQQGRRQLTAIIVQRPPVEERWRVPFSTFVVNTLVGMYVAQGRAADKAFDLAFETMRRLGFQFVASPEGSTVSTSLTEAMGHQQRVMPSVPISR
jgi:hypothetical protein